MLEVSAVDVFIAAGTLQNDPERQKEYRLISEVIIKFY